MVNNQEQLNFWENIIDYNNEIDSVLNSNNNLTKEINKINFKNKIITDIGTGNGNLFKYLKDYKQIIAVDFSKNMINFAKKESKRLNLKKIKFINLNILEKEIETKSDILFSINAFFPENYNEIQNFKENIKNSIKDNGEIYLLLSSFESFIRELQILTRINFEKYQKNNTKENFETFQKFKNLKVGIHGYYHCGKRNRKYWLKEEILEEFSKEFNIEFIKEIKFKRKEYNFSFERFFIKLKK